MSNTTSTNSPEVYQVRVDTGPGEFSIFELDTEEQAREFCHQSVARPGTTRVHCPRISFEWPALDYAPPTEKRYIVNLQIPDAAKPGEWVFVGPSYVRKDRAGVDALIEFERDRDRTFGGLLDASHNKRRLLVREVLVLSTETFGL